jgi:hypothetical protein
MKRILTLGMLMTVVGGLPAADLPPIAQIIAAWKQQESEILTCKIRFSGLRIFRSHCRRIPVADLEKTIAEIAAAPDDTARLKLIDTLQIDDRRGKGVYDSQIVVDGRRFCVRDFRGGQTEERYVFDGEHEGNYDFLNRHLHVHRMGGSKVGTWSLLELRRQPSGRARDRYSVEHATGGTKLTINAPPGSEHAWENGSNYLLDPVTFQILASRSFANGKLRTIAFQADYKRYGEVLFPSYSITYEILDNRLNGLTYTSARDAVFNRPVDEEEFQMDVPAGWVVYDYRAGIQNTVVKSDTPDAVSVLNTAMQLPEYVPPPPSVTTWWHRNRIGFIAALVGFACLAIFLRRRLRHKGSPLPGEPESLR